MSKLPRVAESNRRLFTVLGAQFETEQRGVQQVDSGMRGAPELEQPQAGRILFERALVAVRMLQPEDKVEVARCLKCPSKCSHSCAHVRTLQTSDAKVCWTRTEMAYQAHRENMRRHTGGDGESLMFLPCILSSVKTIINILCNRITQGAIALVFDWCRTPLPVRRH